MRSWATVTILFALVACSSAAFSSLGFNGVGVQDIMTLGRLSKTQAEKAWNTIVSSVDKRADEPAYLAIKFTVAPHEYDTFIKEWRQLDKYVVKEEGNLVHDLKKPINENLFFYSYSEWATMKDLFFHITGNHFQDFVDFTTDYDVAWDLQFLKAVTDTKGEIRASRPGNTHHKAGHDQAYILTKVLVKPSQAKGFIEAWKGTADKVYDIEEGNAIYSLRAMIRNNYELYIYGTWDSYEDFIIHLESEHTKDLIEYTKKHDIVVFSSPLIKYGFEKE